MRTFTHTLVGTHTNTHTPLTRTHTHTPHIYSYVLTRTLTNTCTLTWHTRFHTHEYLHSHIHTHARPAALAHGHLPAGSARSRATRSREPEPAKHRGRRQRQQPGLGGARCPMHGATPQPRRAQKLRSGVGCERGHAPRPTSSAPQRPMPSGPSVPAAFLRDCAPRTLGSTPSNCAPGVPEVRERRRARTCKCTAREAAPRSGANPRARPGCQVSSQLAAGETRAAPPPRAAAGSLGTAARAGAPRNWRCPLRPVPRAVHTRGLFSVTPTCLPVTDLGLGLQKDGLYLSLVRTPNLLGQTPHTSVPGLAFCVKCYFSNHNYLDH